MTYSWLQEPSRVTDPTWTYRADGSLHRLYLPDILYFEKQVRYVIPQSKKGPKVRFSSTMKALCYELEGKGIIQISQSYLVNFQAIRLFRYQDHFVLLHNGQELPVSQRFQKLVTETLMCMRREEGRRGPYH